MIILVEFIDKMTYYSISFNVGKGGNGEASFEFNTSFLVILFTII